MSRSGRVCGHPARANGDAKNYGIHDVRRVHGVGDEAGIDKLFTSLSKGGEILVPLDTDPFGEKYHWVNGRFGLSWLLMLAKA